MCLSDFTGLEDEDEECEEETVTEEDEGWFPHGSKTVRKLHVEDNLITELNF